MSLAPFPSISDDELALLNELLTAELGIRFPEHKREILESRLKPRMQQLRLRSFLDYYVLLQHDAGNGRGEVNRLPELVTNNESYFFRETYQFDALFSAAVDELKAAARETQQLRFLSAGCSSGEEPYTLNIHARENQYRMFGYDVRIDGVDVNAARIATAESGEFGRASMRGTSGEQIERYFSTASETFVLKPPYRKGVSFRVGNLLREETYGTAGSYDVIFCRNVLIYFSEESVGVMLERFHRALRPDGLLFLGHSESAIGVSRAFEPERIGDCIAYRRTASYRS